MLLVTVTYALTQPPAWDAGSNPGKARLLRAWLQLSGGFASAAGLIEGITDHWDRRIDRRTFLKMGGIGAVALLLGGQSERTTSARLEYPSPSYPSMGYPSPDGAVLWTRLAPDPLNGGGDARQNVPGRWEVASDIDAYEETLDKNPHIGYFDARKGGYVRYDLTPEHWRAELRVANSVLDRGSPVRAIASFVVEDGHPGAPRV